MARTESTSGCAKSQGLQPPSTQEEASKGVGLERMSRSRIKSMVISQQEEPCSSHRQRSRVRWLVDGVKWNSSKHFRFTEMSIFASYLGHRRAQDGTISTSPHCFHLVHRGAVPRTGIGWETETGFPGVDSALSEWRLRLEVGQEVQEKSLPGILSFHQIHSEWRDDSQNQESRVNWEAKRMPWNREEQPRSQPQRVLFWTLTIAQRVEGTP